MVRTPDRGTTTPSPNRGLALPDICRPSAARKEDGGHSQRRLADTLGLSTAMLSQLISARRVKIGDPAVLARIDLLDRYVRRSRRGAPVPTEALLAHVKQSRPRRAMPERPPQTTASAQTLHEVANSAELAAAANVLGPRFPALAELLRRVAIERLP